MSSYAKYGNRAPNITNQAGLGTTENNDALSQLYQRDISTEKPKVIDDRKVGRLANHKRRGSRSL